MGITVNGEAVSDRLIREEADQLRPSYFEYMKEHSPDDDETVLEERLHNWAKENVIEQVLLRQAAMADPEPVPEEHLKTVFDEFVERHGGEDQFRKMLGEDDETRTREEARIRENLEAQIRVERLVQRLSGEADSPTDEEIAARFEEQRERFTWPERVWAKHIVKHHDGPGDADSRREELKKALAELDDDVPFEVVADRYSDCSGDGGRSRLLPPGADGGALRGGGLLVEAR